jgi:hypothetical protein
MKDIKNMNLAELADQIERKLDVPMGEDLVQYDIADRLYAIHELTRWVPVSERMPTGEDALNLSDGLCVLVKSAEIPSWHRIVPYSRANSLNGYSHWRRITPLEDKP